MAEQPNNAIYKKGLEMTSKAPDLYDEIQRQLNPSGSRQAPSSNRAFYMDCLGYATIACVVIGLAFVAAAINPQAAGGAAVRPAAT